MSDFLLLHGAGQGAWSWGQVWGHMTAPDQHPPPLYRPRQAMRVRAVDLPGHGAGAARDVASVDILESVQAIASLIERENFTDFTIVGHELGGTVALHAASQLPVAPKRAVLVGGIVPANGKTPASAYPLPARALIRLCQTLGALSGQDIPVPPSIVNRYWCRGLNPMEQAQTVGRFGPLPLRMLTQPVPLNLNEIPCPVTYVVLGSSRLISPSSQRAMASRIPGAAIIEIDAGSQAAVQNPRELAHIILTA